jgi:hypothetical protein
MPPTSYHLNDVVIGLERGACFGFCPEYAVTIAGNGHVVYEGRRNVQEIGTRTDDIAREKVVELLQRFYDVDYFAYRDRYEVERHIEVDPAGNVVQHEGSITDLPGYSVHLQIGPFAKDVWDYWNPPPELRTLEDLIDTTAGTERWVGRRP